MNLGDDGATIMGIVLALLLISTVSAMTLAGPRVLHVIGQDFALFRFLRRTNSNGIPVVAIAFQAVLACLFVATGSFESVLRFTGFTLGLNSFATVVGIFVLRARQPEHDGYRLPLYPLPPLIFLGLMGWTLVYLLLQSPVEGLAGLGIVALGTLVWVATRQKGTS